jgi:small subunit ribosomal protein S6
MPLYELLCLTRPELARPEITKIIQRIGTSVLSSGGIITDIKSYSNQLLAYDIRVPYKKFDEVREIPPLMRYCSWVGPFH